MSSCRNSGCPGLFWLMTVCKHDFNLEYILSTSSMLRSPGLSGVIKTMAQNKPTSASVKHIEFILSANLNVESTRNLALAPFWMESLFIIWPFRQMILLIGASNMHMSLMKSASKSPLLSRVNLSSWVRSWKPGIKPAKSITPRITWAKRWENSFSD